MLCMLMLRDNVLTKADSCNLPRCPISVPHFSNPHPSFTKKPTIDASARRVKLEVRSKEKAYPCEKSTTIVSLWEPENRDPTDLD